jgi:hypothetical protein
MPGTEHSRYIVYVDEAGDHGPVSKEFPVFVLAFCIFEKAEYAANVTTMMHNLKFRHFGHDAFVMHEREIRKQMPPFESLRDATARASFMADLNALMIDAKFTVVASVIDKVKLAQKYNTPSSPYDLALEFGLERLRMFRDDHADRGLMHVVVESRGKNEDASLGAEFKRVVGAMKGDGADMDVVFAKKADNHCGLQLADLIARPIGRHVMNPAQTNRAYEIIEPKFRKSGFGKIVGYGLKVFPS